MSTAGVEIALQLSVLDGVTYQCNASTVLASSANKLSRLIGPELARRFARITNLWFEFETGVRRMRKQGVSMGR